MAKGILTLSNDELDTTVEDSNIRTVQSRIDSPDQFIRGTSGLHRPKDMGILSVPKPRHLVNTVSAEDIAKVAGPPNAERVLSGELALAYSNFPAFLRKRLSKEDNKLAYDVHAILDTIDNLRTNGYVITPLDDDSGYTSRRITRHSYFDRELKQKAYYETSAPGAVERVCMEAVHITTEHGFRDHTIIENALNYSMQLVEECRRETYRRDTDGLIKLPEMPELTRTLLDAYRSPNLATFPALRERVLTHIQLLQVPESMREELLFAMQDGDNLDHPLAFQLHTAACVDNPNSRWVTEQFVKRKEVLLLISQLESPQALFDSYQTLRDLSKKLVTATDPRYPQQWAVGYDIEFGAKYADGVYPRNFDVLSEGTAQGMQLEIKPQIETIGHGLLWQQRLSVLQRYFQDTQARVSSLHLHIDADGEKSRFIFPDLKEAAIPPVKESAIFLGGLLTNGAKAYDLPIEIHRKQDSAEIRAFPMIAQSAGLKPQVLGGLAEMYIAARKEPAVPLKAGIIEKGDSMDMQQLIFGHICANLRNPEGVLGALKALEDPYILSSINFPAIVRTYLTSKASAEALVEIAKPIYQKGKIQGQIQTIEWELQVLENPLIKANELLKPIGIMELDLFNFMTIAGGGITVDMDRIRQHPKGKQIETAMGYAGQLIYLNYDPTTSSTYLSRFFPYTIPDYPPLVHIIADQRPMHAWPPECVKALTEKIEDPNTSYEEVVSTFKRVTYSLNRLSLEDMLINPTELPERKLIRTLATIMAVQPNLYAEQLVEIKNLDIPESAEIAKAALFHIQTP